MIKKENNKEFKSQWFITIGVMLLFFIFSQNAFTAPHFYHHPKVHAKILAQNYHKHCIKASVPTLPVKKKSNNNRKVTSFTSPSFHLFGFYADATQHAILKKVVKFSTFYSFIPFYHGVHALDALRAPPFSSFC